MVAPLPQMQLLALLAQQNPQALAEVAASAGLKPPTATMPSPEPGAQGAGALPTLMPNQPTQPPLGPPAAMSPVDQSLGALMTGVGPATATPDSIAGRAPSAPGASLPGGGRFDPQALAIMQAMMGGQPPVNQMSLGRLIAGG